MSFLSISYLHVLERSYSRGLRVNIDGSLHQPEAHNRSPIICWRLWCHGEWSVFDIAHAGSANLWPLHLPLSSLPPTTVLVSSKALQCHLVYLSHLKGIHKSIDWLGIEQGYLRSMPFHELRYLIIRYLKSYHIPLNYIRITLIITKVFFFGTMEPSLKMKQSDITTPLPCVQERKPWL